MISLVMNYDADVAPLKSASMKRPSAEFRLAAGIGNRSGIVASADQKTNSKGFVTGAYGEGVPKGAGFGFFARQGTKNAWFGAGVGYSNSLTQDSRTWDFLKIG